MSFPNSDIVMLSVLGVSIFAGLIMWWALAHKMRSMRFELQPMTTLMKCAPQPANEVIDVFDVIDNVPSRDSSVRIRVHSPVNSRGNARVASRVGKRLRAVE